jgi:hypothetical protein
MPFPLLGLGFIAFGLRRGFKANRLLAWGKVGLGVLKSKESTGSRVNGQPVYKLIFEFVADNGATYAVTSRTHLSATLEDEVEERLLYDPADPANAVMLDNLPGSPDIDARGRIHAANLYQSLLPLLLPALTLAGHGTVFLLVMF